LSKLSSNVYSGRRGGLLPYREEGVGGKTMKPSKRSGVPRAPEAGEPRGSEAGAAGGTRDDDVERVEGDEGGGGSYGNPRPRDEDEKSDRSRERG